MIRSWRNGLFALALACACLAGPGAAAAAAGAGFTQSEVRSMAAMSAVIRTTFGEMEVSFNPDVAPVHVDNFITLVRRGFYDRTTFHWVKPGFIIQGGDPNTTELNRSRHGLGGPGYSLSPELSSMPQVRGAVSMAMTADGLGSGSQFFIMLADARHLDGKYTVFGHVIRGMDVADRIAAQPTDSNHNPLERVEVRISIQGPADARPAGPMASPMESPKASEEEFPAAPAR